MSGVEIPTGYTSEDQEDLYDILEDFFGDAATENALSLGLFETLHQRGWRAPGLSPELASELQRLRAALQRLASVTPASINAATAAEACATVRAIAATALDEESRA